MFTVLGFSGLSITVSGPSNGLDLSGGHGRGGGEKEESLPAMEKLLLGT